MASHDFITILRNKHSFNLSVFGFSLSTTFLVNIRQRIRMTILGMTLSTDWSFPLQVKKPLFTLVNSLIKLTIRLTPSISVKRPRFVFTMRQLLRLPQTINITKPSFSIVMRLFSKVTSWILPVPKIGILFNPVFAKFHALWEYDNQTLSSLDGTTLADMDYSVVS